MSDLLSLTDDAFVAAAGVSVSAEVCAAAVFVAVGDAAAVAAGAVVAGAVAAVAFVVLAGVAAHADAGVVLVVVLVDVGVAEVVSVAGLLYSDWGSHTGDLWVFEMHKNVLNSFPFLDLAWRPHSAGGTPSLGLSAEHYY